MFKIRKIREVKERISQSVHQEFESTDGGGWFSSGDYYLFTETSKWLYIFGIPIWRLEHTYDLEFYCKEENI